MPISNDVRKYDPIQDPANPVTTAPPKYNWALILIVALSGGFSASLTSYATGNKDPVLIAGIGIGITLATMAAAMKQSDAQSRKELEGIVSAKEIQLAKIQALSDTIVAKTTGQPATPSAVESIGVVNVEVEKK